MKRKYIFLFLLIWNLQLSTAQVTQTVGLFQNLETSFNGYTLFTPANSKTTYLIDNCGDLVHSWQSQYNPGLSDYLLENGNLLRSAKIPSNFNAGGSGGRIEIFSWEGDLLWGYDHSAFNYHQHHDVHPLPNGNILVLAWDLHTQAEAIQKGFNPAAIKPEGIWTESVVEIQPIFGSNEANIVWEWHLWDHLIQDLEPTISTYGNIAEHPELVNCNYGSTEAVDWIHANGIDYNPQLDQIIINSRNLSEFWIIDHSTTTAEAASHTGGLRGKGGDLLYRWGNPRTYNRGTIDDQRLWAQHNANWIKEGLPGEGEIMIFNNGLGRPDGTHSSIDVITPPLDNTGNYFLEPQADYGPDALSWTYEAVPAMSFFSGRISGATRQANGNTLICEGNGGRFFEVNPFGVMQWLYICPVRNGTPLIQGQPAQQNDVFRITRYAPDYPAFEGKELIPSGPIEGEPLESNCEIYTDMTDAISPINILDGVQVVNNPFDAQITIDNKTQTTIFIKIVHLSGQTILETKTNNFKQIINTTSWQKGMYIVHFQNENASKFATQKIVKL